MRSKVKNECSLLDLPELALECILEKLEPNELCIMAQVCASLRDRCRNDYLWERHMNKKCGVVIRDIASREKLIRFLSSACTISGDGEISKPIKALPVVSTMTWYLSLENGQFWFPAQVYNRQKGHHGFMLSCYDAQLCYDRFTDTFQARYPPHGPERPVIEKYVHWDRIRAPPIGNPPLDLHISDCLHDLRPGDHIEIQWTTHREFPYGWWYGVVGHLETCDKIGTLCQCHNSDTVVVEFNQYSPSSRWSGTTVNRNHHREGGSYAEGFYGGIRKIYDEEQIAVWKKFWPKEIFDRGVLWLHTAMDNVLPMLGSGYL